MPGEGDRNSAAARAAELRAEIDKHNRLYYQEAQPSISDQEFDRLLRELQKIEADHPELIEADSPTLKVGGEAPLEAFRQVRHLVPMQSLDNTYDEAEVVAFVERADEGKKAVVDQLAGGHSRTVFVVTPARPELV